MAARSHNFQTIAWFWDLYKRDLIDLDPPYQRRNVWNSKFKEYFVDTVLLNYPAPAIFLFQDVSPDGALHYAVVDGKQRLLSLFQFIKDEYPIGDQAELTELRELYFSNLSKERKTKFWSYTFNVEYLDTTDAQVLNSIFDRINRNVAKLTAQELRHAKYDGPFIKAAEKLAEWMLSTSPEFPKITLSARNQMKDVEFVAGLLLGLEEGPKGYSTAEFDQAFSDRDIEWEAGLNVEPRFIETIETLKLLIDTEAGASLKTSRLKNQADFYSFFLAVAENVSRVTANPSAISAALLRFVEKVDSPETRAASEIALEYFNAARSASNDSGPRSKRVRILSSTILSATL